jgi:cytoskeletal protein RodZ
MDDGISDWIKSINNFTGVALRTIRERMGVDLKEIFAATRIQPQYLEDIENEQFSSFRAEVYLRSYLIEYTRFLSLDTQKVLTDYLPRYRKFQGINADI